MSGVGRSGAVGDGMGGTLAAWLDGARLDPAAGAVPVSDLGLRQGLGVFTTMRLHRGRVAGLGSHLARLTAGGERLGIAVPDDTVRTGLATVAAAAGDADAVLRVTVTAGDAGPGWPPAAGGRARTLVTLHPAPPWCGAPEDAAIVPGPRAPAGLGDVKTTSYAGSVVAGRAARAAGASIALLHVDGGVLEAADGNLVLVRGGTLTTPPADGRILPGVTRTQLLALAPEVGLATSEVVPDVDDVRSADLVLVTSAVRGIRPVGRLDGVELGALGTPASRATLAALRAGLDRLAAEAPRVTGDA